jgi:hypothetical protein
MAEEEYPRTKAEFLDKLAQGWQMLDDAIKQYTDEQLTQPRDLGGWSAKDHLAHLIRWEAGMLALLNKHPRWEGMRISTEVWNAEFDEMNAVMQQEDKDIPLADVLAGLKQMHERFTAKVEETPEADLYKPYVFFQPFATHRADDTRPAIMWMIGNSYEHYAEHLPWIATLIGNQPSS